MRNYFPWCVIAAVVVALCGCTRDMDEATKSYLVDDKDGKLPGINKPIDKYGDQKPSDKGPCTESGALGVQSLILKGNCPGQEQKQDKKPDSKPKQDQKQDPKPKQEQKPEQKPEQNQKEVPKFNLKAYRMPYKMGDTAICAGGGLSCKFKADESMQSFSTRAPYYVVKIFVTGSVPNDESYKWSMTVNDSETMLMKMSSKAWPKGLFILDGTPETSGDAPFTTSHHYMMVVPDQSKEKIFNNVIVTVTNGQGGQQTLKFSEIRVPSQEAIDAVKKKADEVAAAVAKADYEKCHNLAATALTINSVQPQYVPADPYNPTFDVSSSQEKGKKFPMTGAYTGAFTITGGVAPYHVTLKGHEVGNDKWLLLEEVYVDSNNVIQWPQFQKADSTTGEVTDTTTLEIRDDSTICKQTIQATIKRTLYYPPAIDEKIEDIKTIHLKFTTEWTDSDSTFQVQILNDGTVLAQTSTFCVDENCGGSGEDPTDFDKDYPLKPVGNHGFDSVSDISGIQILTVDPGCCADMTFTVDSIKLNGKYYSAQVDAVQSGEFPEKITYSAPGDFKASADGGIWLPLLHPKN